MAQGTRSKTKPSTPRLSEVARHVVIPSGTVSTGFPAVEAKCAEMGIRFRWWQKPIGQIILSKRTDGTYAATVGGTGLSIPRQVGKTFLVGAIVFALCLLRPGLTVIWTAHRVRTAEETFKKMQAFARRKKIAPHVAKIVLGSGEEEVGFHNGSRILFGARATGFGRGFDEVDVLIFDEAQILTEASLDDMVPATNQSRQDTSALLLFMGTPPKPTDPGEVFTRMRTEALSGEDEDTGWIEFGADPDYEPTVLPAPLTERDWEQIAKANPSFPDDTPRVAILRMRKKLGPDSFKREGAGVWDDDSAAYLWPAWPQRTGQREDPMALAIAGDVDKNWLCLGGSSGAFVGVVKPAGIGLTITPRSRESEFVTEVARIAKERDVPVGIQEKGPAWTLKAALEAEGARVVPVDFNGFVQACADFEKAIHDKTLTHAANDADLDAAVREAKWRKVNDRLVISRKTGDISALEAVILAQHAVATAANYDVLDSIY